MSQTVQNLSAIQVAFLDLDGTLTDPKPGITGCILHALRELGEPLPQAEALTWCIGPPLLESFARLVGSARSAQALALYRERFADVGLFENRLYDGVPEALQMLRDQSVTLYLATSKPLIYARRITAHFGLDELLDAQFGSELDGTRADKSALLQHALAATGIPASSACMVGDRRHDMVGALANGLAPVGVLYGYGSQQELEDSGARRLLHAPEDLASLSTTRF